jgi:hypothetical protein
MQHAIRPQVGQGAFAQAPDLTAIQRVVPTAVIQAALADAHRTTKRTRKLSLEWVVLLLICRYVYGGLPLVAMLARLVKSLNLMREGAQAQPPGPAALAYRRKQLGAEAMAGLFHRVVRPIATRQTPGAFLGDLRLVALDGWKQDVPDTPQNAARFGRPSSDRGDGAFPQAQIVWLCEVGTHAALDAGVWPCHTAEDVGAHRLMRSVTPGMLLLADAGLYSFSLLDAVVARGADALFRLPAQVKPALERTLPDGSALVWLSPREHKPRQRGEGRLVRLISYRIDDPNSPKLGQVYRLVTTCLDEKAYPAAVLAAAYHERWEIEGATDEVQVHQERPGRMLVSQTPVGVVQEIYALLLAHFVVRSLMHEAAMEVPIDPDRISFIGTLRVLQAALPLLLVAEPAKRPCMFERMLEGVAQAGAHDDG